MEEGVWTLVLPYFKEYSVQCINWRNVKEQSEFAGRVIDVAKDENVILVGWSLGALAAVQAHKKDSDKRYCTNWWYCQIYKFERLYEWMECFACRAAEKECGEKERRYAQAVL